MNGVLLHALREAVSLALLVAAPPVLAATVVGLVMALVQGATRIEERTLSVVPRLVAAAAALAIAAPWIGLQLVRFTTALYDVIPSLGRS